MNCANHPDRERQAFCQNCGKPVCSECARVIGQAVFCEPCLEARLAASAPPPAGFAGSAPTLGAAASGSGYQSVPGGTSVPYPGSAGARPFAPAAGAPFGKPNPVVAGLLGFIPGVGAMYNGQYAKGLVHLLVFAILVSLADHNGIFGLFVAFWIFYQAVEAYQTANARREGVPPPNPFGLNDIGERLGFGRGWTPAPPRSPASGSEAPVPPFVDPVAGPASAAQGVPFTPPFRDERAWAPPPPPASGVPPSYSPMADPVPAPSMQTAPPLPVGAIILIGLGLLFLVGDTPWVGSLPFHFVLPVLIIGLGAWIFVRRLTAGGTGFADDGSAAYRLRLLSAIRASVWIVLVGVLFLLDNLNILSWGRSWPMFIIVAGVLAFVHRSTAADVRRRTADATFGTPGPSAYAPRAEGESER